MSSDTQTQAIPFKTQNWEGSFSTNPEDRSLAVAIRRPGDLEELPDRYLELWYRFSFHGIESQWGEHCIAMSYFLRKVMVLHGFNAKVKQVIAEYRHPERHWAMITGNPEATVSGIATHSVVISDNWILDFAQMPLYKTFGAMAPKAIVARSEFGSWQDLGFFGQVRYIEKPVDHAETLNERITQRESVNNMVREYFSVYRAR